MVESILDGTGCIIDGWLGLDENSAGSTLPRYKHRGNLKQLPQDSEGLKNPDGETLVRGLLTRITDNWKGREDKDRKPSSENWRFSKQPIFNPRSTSLEKTLEKSIVVVTENYWANQVPVASGLVNRGEGKRAIDLVHQNANNTYEFIELKIGPNADSPLFAAMEILLYGLIYVFSRKNMNDLEYDSQNILLAAESVELQVLAPAKYYKDCQLGWLEESLASGLAKLSEDSDLDCSLSFKFRSFPETFEWNLWSRKLLDALEGIGSANC